ncbi:hypothetical protein MTO96_051053 [Rhipicephalus appendiculatus]
MADVYEDNRRNQAAVPPAVDPPEYVPPANVYDEDEDEGEEFFSPAATTQAFRGVNPLLVLAIIFLNIAGTIALVLYTIERNVEVTEPLTRSTKLVTSSTSTEVEPTENVTGAQRQFGDYAGVGIDIADM